MPKKRTKPKRASPAPAVSHMEHHAALANKLIQNQLAQSKYAESQQKNENYKNLMLSSLDQPDKHENIFY